MAASCQCKLRSGCIVCSGHAIPAVAVVSDRCFVAAEHVDVDENDPYKLKHWIKVVKIYRLKWL